MLLPLPVQQQHRNLQAVNPETWASAGSTYEPVAGKGKPTACGGSWACDCGASGTQAKPFPVPPLVPRAAPTPHPARLPGSWEAGGSTGCILVHANLMKGGDVVGWSVSGGWRGGATGSAAPLASACCPAHRVAPALAWATSCCGHKLPLLPARRAAAGTLAAAAATAASPPPSPPPLARAEPKPGPRRAGLRFSCLQRTEQDVRDAPG